MTVAVRLPDGRTIQTNATNAKDAQIAASRFMASEDAGKRGRSAPDQVRSLANGATLGLANLADAAGAAGETGLYNLLHPGQGHYGMADAFDAVRREDNARDRTFSAQHPVQATGLGLLGGLAMPGGGALAKFVAGAPKTAVQGGSLLSRLGQATARTAPVVGRSAAVGGGLGAVAGAAGSDPGQETQGAIGGGVTGALTGAAVPIAARGATAIARSAPARTVTRALSKASGAIGGPTLNPQTQALQRLQEAMGRDGASPDQLRAVTNEWLKAGVTPSLMDVVNNNGAGQNTMSLLRGGALKSGAARNVMNTYDRQTAADLIPNAMAQARNLTPGDTQTAEAAIAARTQARGDQARTTYAAPYAADAPIISEPAQAALSDGPGQGVLRAVRADAQERLPIDPQASQRTLDDVDRLLAGNFDEPVSGATLDRLRIGFRERGGKLSRAGNNSRASGALGRQDILDNELSDVPDLGPARAAYADASKGIDAVDLGRSGLAPSTIPADYDQALTGLTNATSTPAASEDVASAARTGLRSATEQAIGNSKDGAVGGLNALRSQNNRAIFARTFGDDVASAFDSGIDKLTQQRQNASSLNPNTGSATALRQEDGIGDIPLTKHGIIRSVIDGLRNGVTLTDAEREALAKMATMKANDFSPTAPAANDPSISPTLSVVAAPYLARQVGAAQ